GVDIPTRLDALRRAPQTASHMRRIRAAGGAILVLLCATSAAIAEPVSGIVVDGITLKPIAGATVTGPDGTAVKTGKDGRFTLADVMAGPGALAFHADGYEDASEDVTVPEGTGLTDQYYVLYTPGAAGEVVTVNDQAPVPPPPGKQDLTRD